MFPGAMAVGVSDVTWIRAAGTTTSWSIELTASDQARWRVDRGPVLYADTRDRCYATGEGVSSLADSNLTLHWDLRQETIQYSFGLRLRPQDIVVGLDPADEHQNCKKTDAFLIYAGGTDQAQHAAPSGRLNGTIDTPAKSAAWQLLTRKVTWDLEAFRPR
jgi:hypothetical protein